MVFKLSARMQLPNAKVSLFDVLHMFASGHGVWNGGEHHVERLEAEQVPWWLYGRPLSPFHRRLRAH